MSEEDAELAAIRARMLAELSGPAAAPAVGQKAAGVLTLTDATFPAEAPKHPFLVLDCWATWCAPCRIVAPIVEDLAREWAGQVAFAKLDVDENPRVAAAFQVSSIPTLLLFQNGRYVDRVIGALPKPALAQAIRRAFRLRGDGGRAPAR